MNNHEQPADFRPAADWKHLRLRAGLLARVRRFFDERGFLEVETPLLSRDVVIDRNLDPVEVAIAENSADSAPRLWLQASPEAGMKRLLAAGGDALYQVTRSFRRGERGRLHNLEFTLVEWYRCGDDMPRAMDLLAEFCIALLDCTAVDRLSYRQAFERRAGINPHTADPGELAAKARELGISVPEGFAAADRDAWLDLLLVSCVEPHLGGERPVLVYDYPASQAALAKVRRGDPPVAERFELYFRGVELANGYHELTDPAELRQRAAAENARRAARGASPLPVESRLLAAIEHGLPDCSGVALGFDRLVMLAAGASSIDEVIAFPFDRA